MDGSVKGAGRSAHECGDQCAAHKEGAPDPEICDSDSDSGSDGDPVERFAKPRRVRQPFLQACMQDGEPVVHLPIPADWRTRPAPRKAAATAAGASSTTPVPAQEDERKMHDEEEAGVTNLLRGGARRGAAPEKPRWLSFRLNELVRAQDQVRL